MYVPDTPIEIKKIKLETVLSGLQDNAQGFYEKFITVFNSVNNKEKYAYLIEYPYGFPIIEDARMYFLKKNRLGNYGNKEKVFLTNEFDSTTDKEELWNNFVKDCERNPDHPLSIVLSNCVEVYTEQESGAYTSSTTITKKYQFPLNQIEVGGLFGVWGTIDLVSGISGNVSTVEKKTDWHASAGKSCFQFLFPIPESKKSNKFYQTEFENIFGSRTSNLTDALHYIINNKIEIDNVKTKILVFPEHYFVIDENDSKALKDNKLLLQNYLYSYGWLQFAKHRALLWENKALMKKLEVEHNDFHFHFLNHLIEIFDNKDYVLTLVSKSDKILFETFKYLCNQLQEKVPALKKEKDQFKNLLEYNAPFFFHYSKINETNWGIIPYYAPAINIIIPKEVRVTKISDKFQRNKKQKVISLLKELQPSKSDTDLIIIDSQNNFETIFCKEYLLANVGKSTDMNKTFKDLFGDDFKEITTRISLRENKNTVIFNSSVILKKK